MKGKRDWQPLIFLLAIALGVFLMMFSTDERIYCKIENFFSIVTAETERGD